MNVISIYPLHRRANHAASQFNLAPNEFDILKKGILKPNRGPIYRQPPPIYRDVSAGLPFPINRERWPINRTSIGGIFPILVGKIH